MTAMRADESHATNRLVSAIVLPIAVVFVSAAACGVIVAFYDEHRLLASIAVAGLLAGSLAYVGVCIVADIFADRFARRARRDDHARS
jgi:hypothetical protein